MGYKTVNKVVKTMSTETAHRLVNYSGNCQHLHGHSYKWEVCVSSGDLNGLGMVIDFKDLKSVMKETIYIYDHALILSETDPLLSFEISPQDLLLSPMGEAPRLFVYPFNPTAENLARHVFSRIHAMLPMYYTLEYVKVWETETSFAVHERKHA